MLNFADVTSTAISVIRILGLHRRSLAGQTKEVINVLRHSCQAKQLRVGQLILER